MGNNDKRESFKSSFGFLLVSAGCAIGIGNVWKFPYVAGQNGGGVFVLFYLLFLLIMGVPVLTMELAVGRSSRKGAVDSFRALEKPKSKWHIHGYVCIIGCALLMMYYTSVSGWMLGYFGKFAAGTFSGLTPDGVDGVFGSMLSNPWEMIAFMGITVLIGTVVCSFGLQNGIERITKYMMLGLLGLIVVLGINSVLLPGGMDGLKFYLMPDFDRAMEQGLFDVIVAAMNQAFFTLSIGIGSMQIFGSYMTKDRTIGNEAVRICGLDTFVALMSGLIIFPACFAYSVEPSAGPPLIFEALPRVFVDMPGGRLWGSLFFLFMTFASLTTVIAVFEGIIANVMETKKWQRRKASIIVGIVIFVTSIPAILGYNVLKGVTFIGARDVLDSEDFIVSNLLLPIGALVYLLFCVTKWGWGFDKYLEECNEGKGFKLPKALKPYFQFVLPVLIIVILVVGLM
ncbi:MAG: sodium-dependent transporter [Ruminococcaceae bacterium]|nr:sodium-dependent transporter [Oscillospiraceae bacterium]